MPPTRVKSNFWCRPLLWCWIYMTMTSALCICVVLEFFSSKNQTTFNCCLKWCSELIFKYNDADLVSCDDSRIIKRCVLLMFAVSGGEWRVLSGHQSTGADPAIIKIKTENCTTLSAQKKLTEWKCYFLWTVLHDLFGLVLIYMDQWQCFKKNISARNYCVHDFHWTICHLSCVHDFHWTV